MLIRSELSFTNICLCLGRTPSNSMYFNELGVWLSGYTTKKEKRIKDNYRMRVSSLKQETNIKGNRQIISVQKSQFYVYVVGTLFLHIGKLCR